jgi:predicted peptidase
MVERRVRSWYNALMIARLFAVVVLGLVQFSCAAPERDNAPAALEMVDLSVEVDGTIYPCKALISARASRGGGGILFLHGSGECGTHGIKMLTVGLPGLVMRDPEQWSRVWPQVLIVPQKPTVDSEWEDHEDAVLAMLDKAVALGLVDPERVGITGLSQGGHGTVALASRHPDRFVAAAPVCAYIGRAWDEDGVFMDWRGVDASSPVVVDAAEGLSGMPVWIHHGDSDSVVPVGESRALHAAFERLGADVRYTEYEGVDHNSWDAAYGDPDLARWLVEQTD